MDKMKFAQKAKNVTIFEGYQTQAGSKIKVRNEEELSILSAECAYQGAEVASSTVSFGGLTSMAIDLADQFVPLTEEIVNSINYAGWEDPEMSESLNIYLTKLSTSMALPTPSVWGEENCQEFIAELINGVHPFMKVTLIMAISHSRLPFWKVLLVTSGKLGISHFINEACQPYQQDSKEEYYMRLNLGIIFDYFQWNLREVNSGEAA